MKRFVARRLFPALLAAVLAVAGSAAALAQPEVKLGLALAESGPLAYLSSQYRKGYEAAIATANLDGKIKFVLVTHDHRGLPADAITAAKRLIEQDGVKTLDVALPSTVVFAVMPISQQAKMPLIGGYTQVPSIVDQGDPYLFRTSTRMDLNALGLSKIIHGNPGNIKTIAMLAPNDDYGRSSIESMEKALVSLGSPKVVYKDFYERDQADFSAILLKMKSLDPDALFLDVRYPASATVLKQMAEIGLKKPLFSTVNFYNEKLAAQTGALMEGTYLNIDWAPELTDDASKAFVEAYKKVHGATPEPAAANGWAAAMTAIKAIQAAGPNASGDEIRAAMAKLDFVGPTGRIHFDAKGDANVPPKILLFKDKRYSPVQ